MNFKVECLEENRKFVMVYKTEKCIISFFISLNQLSSDKVSRQKDVNRILLSSFRFIGKNLFVSRNVTASRLTIRQPKQRCRQNR